MRDSERRVYNSIIPNPLSYLITKDSFTVVVNAQLETEKQVKWSEPEKLEIFRQKQASTTHAHYPVDMLGREGKWNQ